jgi:hypothetical protein
MVLWRVVALLASGGAIIHLSVIRHHLDFPGLAVGFGAMGLAQSWFAARVFTKPSPRVCWAGAGLHVTIAATWLASRTTGLAVVAGAQHPAAIGVADLTANIMSLAVVAGLVAAGVTGRTGQRKAQGTVVERWITALAGAVVLLTAVPAVLAPHDHAGHELDDGSSVVGGHDHGDGPAGDHDHGHG